MNLCVDHPFCHGFYHHFYVRTVNLNDVWTDFFAVTCRQHMRVVLLFWGGNRPKPISFADQNVGCEEAFSGFCSLQRGDTTTDLIKTVIQKSEGDR